MARAISANQIHPIVDRVLACEDAPDAYRYYESARPFGKVVISVG
jgi:NADPH:quinone reductase-like Zn-dependent oxidoreductase